MKKNCLYCGKIIKNSSNSQKYHKECYIKQRKKYKREYDKERRKLHRKALIEYSKKYYQDNKDKWKIRNQSPKRRKWVLEYGRRPEIKEHRKEYSKEWRKKNPEKRREQKARNYQRHKNKIKQKTREYKKNNPEKRKEWSKKELLIPRNKINRLMGTLIRRALKSKKRGQRWEKLVGYTVKDLMEYLEKQFNSKMNWENHGPYWHIDHIKPKSLFTFESYNDKEFKECWALSNLQPLEAIKNLEKGYKY